MEGFLKERIWALGKLCQIVLGPRFQNLNFEMLLGAGPQKWFTVTLKKGKNVKVCLNLCQGEFLDFFS